MYSKNIITNIYVILNFKSRNIALLKIFRNQWKNNILILYTWVAVVLMTEETVKYYIIFWFCCIEGEVQADI
jgi:hypothetical protein